MAEPVVAFLSGVGVSLIGALTSYALTKYRERRRLIEERRFEIYMRLMDVHASYFWFMTAEMHKEPVPKDVRKRCHDLSWQIADMLRATDEIDSIDQILDVLLGPAFETAKERHEEMGRVIDQLGRRINPRYTRKIRQISEENLRSLGIGRSSNAPGSTSHLWK